VSLAIVSSTCFADHLSPPGHPERPERAGVMRRVATRFAAHGATLIEPRDASTDDLTRVHDPAYVARVLGMEGRSVAFDDDTFTSPRTVGVALRAAGAGLTAVDTVLADGGPTRAFALVRPPGHHAERDRAMGFCLFNNVAVAAAHARAAGVERVAIVDYDVHHGNGTQRMFYDDPSVLFISSHQFPYYPGSGAASETGAGAGRGFTVNLPLDAGAEDADYDAIYRDVVVPVLRQFRPQLLLVSAGFDAFRDDPLGGMRLSVDQFRRLTAMLAAVADECCGGRLVAITEGGYDLQGLDACLEAALLAVSDHAPQAPFEPAPGPAPRGRASIASLRPHLAGIWTI
jgi:acetoin utilization deacetylase AcuC-like enzyme